MNTHILKSHIAQIFASLILNSLLTPCDALAQRKPPSGGRIAMVIDERLAVLRQTPDLSGKFLRRLGRGRLVAIRTATDSHDGVAFFLVNVSRRTHGWIQRDAVVSPFYSGDDNRLLELIRNSSDFERIARARIFLDHFLRSPLRPAVLLLLGDTAEEAAARLSREAGRKITPDLRFGSPPPFTYFLNYSGLDRYSRQSVGFVFDKNAKEFHYEGTAWREITRRYPKAPEAIEAHKRLARLTTLAIKN